MLKAIFGKIYNATYDKALAYTITKCGKIEEVEDILQEVYTELFRTLAQKGEGYIKYPEAFVMQLVKSKIYQYYSEKERKIACTLVENMETLKQEEEDVASDAMVAAWEDALIDQLTAQEVMEYIAGKDQLTKDIFYQHYFQDKTLKEIADAHGVKESTVKNRLYRTVKEMSAMKKFAFAVAILILAALLAKPVYTMAEDMLAKLKRYFKEDTQDTLEIMSLGAAYRDYKKRIENGELSEDIHISINEEIYTIDELEKIWVNNPWLEELDWDNNDMKTEDGIVSYVIIYEDELEENEVTDSKESSNGTK